MITEDYCSQEVVKLLEEKGFNNTSMIESITYNKLTKTLDFTYYKYVDGVKTLVTDNIDPSDLTHIWQDGKVTHQMAMKWLRDVYDIHISVNKTFLINDIDNKPYLVYVCTKKCHTSYNAWSEYHSTYEEAVEAALKYVLKNLI